MAYMNIEFPGGLKVNARSSRHLIETDQNGSVPTPFELFLGSLATCAGIFALGFCKNKGLPTEGLDISMDLEMNRSNGMISKVIFDVKLPEGFPEKYRSAIVNSIELCSVKRHMLTPPEFQVRTSI